MVRVITSGRSEPFTSVPQGWRGTCAHCGTQIETEEGDLNIGTGAAYAVYCPTPGCEHPIPVLPSERRHSPLLHTFIRS